jgi:NADPH-dependent glutamate synthase beta subunit-like oxidoreductase/Fe-S-cluster-containing hydrogenase component 2
VLRREIQAIEELGVEFRLNTPVGIDGGPSLEDLREEYGAVFLGLGAHRSRRLRVPGEDLKGVVHGTDFLRTVWLAQEEGTEDLVGQLRQTFGIEMGPRAVVVGGGNTAVDVARTLRRLGTEQIRILYRRSRREMPAISEEISAAEEEGIVLDVLATPVQFHGQDGRITALECVRMELGEPDESGRRRPLPVSGTEFMLDADMVVLAVGQEPELPALPAELCDGNGWLHVDEETGRTPLEGVFAAGDVVRISSVIEAIGAGRQVATTILRYLRGESGETPKFERPVARWSREELEERVHRSRQEPPVLPPRRRGNDFAEVERAFTAEQAVVEASRCLACATCSECLECLDVCEPQAIDHNQIPHRFEMEADGVLLAGGYDLSLPEGAYHLGEEESSRSIETLLTSLPTGEVSPALVRGGGLPVVASPTRLGIFLCQCGDQIAGSLDLDALQERLPEFPTVVRVEQVPFACLPEGIAALREATAGLDGAVLAACSCCNLAQACYSCSTQRVRCREGLGVWHAEEASVLPPWAWEYINLREHDAWIHGPDEALEAAVDGITAAVARLTAGPVVPVVAAVEPDRCRACGTCQTLCKAEAIRLETDEQGRTWAHVDESRCLACGTCAAHCPTGAVVAGRVNDRQLEATVEALVGAGQRDRIVVFACNWGGHSGVEAAGMRHQALPAGVRTVRVPCLGRLSPGLLLRTLEEGAAGVLLAGCHELSSAEEQGDGCHFEFGREMATAVLSQAQALADLLGLGAERLGMVSVAPGDGRTFVRNLGQFVLQVRGVPAGSRE